MFIVTQFQKLQLVSFKLGLGWNKHIFTNSIYKVECCQFKSILIVNGKY